MDWGEIVSYLATAVGGGGIVSVLNWKLSKRKATAETKQEEIEVIRKTIDEVYKPTIESLNDQVKELREEVTTLRGEIKRIRAERDECHQTLTTLQEQVSRLVRSRDSRGRYAKEPRKNETTT